MTVPCRSDESCVWVVGCARHRRKPPVRILRVLSAAIYAYDATRLAFFYEALIGNRSIVDPDGRFFVLAPPNGAFEVHIVSMAEEFRHMVEISVPPTPRIETPIKLVLDVEDMDAAEAVVTAHGGSLSPAQETWTWREMVHRDGIDPEGNVFQLRAPS